MKRTRTSSMTRFSKDKQYIFRAKSIRSRGPVAGTGLNSVTYSFMARVSARSVDLYLFRSAIGKWRESFTPYQLGDYTIEKAA